MRVTARSFGALVALAALMGCGGLDQKNAVTVGISSVTFSYPVLRVEAWPRGARVYVTGTAYYVDDWGNAQTTGIGFDKYESQDASGTHEFRITSSLPESTYKLAFGVVARNPDTGKQVEQQWVASRSDPSRNSGSSWALTQL